MTTGSPAPAAPKPDRTAGTPPWRRSLPWLWTLLPALSGSVLCYVFYQVAVDYDLWGFFGRWRWSSLWPFYGDLAMTMQHFQEAQTGADLLGDPKSEFAYPRAFLALRHLHLQDLPVAVTGTLHVAVWMLAAIGVLRPRTPARAVLTTLLFIAPPILLGFERANIDLLLSAYCAGTALLWARTRTTAGLAGPVTAVALAALLKLYPAFLLVGGAWTESGRRRIPWLAACGILGLYWAFHAEEVALVMSKFHLGFSMSWGALTIFNRQHLENLPHLWLVAVGTYTVAFVAAAFGGHALRKRFADVVPPPSHWALYWFGAAICCGSFLATNYAFRWTYALLPLPLLLEVAARPSGTAAWWARFTLLMLAATLAAPLNLDPRHAPFLLVQFANWAAVLSLAFGFTALRRSPAALPPPA